MPTKDKKTEMGSSLNLLRCACAFLIVLVVSAVPAQGQTAQALVALDAVIAEIRTRHLGEAPRPTPERDPCDMMPDVLVAQYIHTFERFRNFNETMQQVSEVERGANEAIRNGDFCDSRIVRDQKRGIESANALDLDDVLANSQRIAECAPVLRQNAELRLSSVRSPAQLAQVQQTIERMRDMHGDALAIASQMAYALDLRQRLVRTMEDNVSVCG